MPVAISRGSCVLFASVQCTARRDSFAKYNSNSNFNSNSLVLAIGIVIVIEKVIVIVMITIVIIAIAGYGTFGLPCAVTVRRLRSFGAVRWRT